MRIFLSNIFLVIFATITSCSGPNEHKVEDKELKTEIYAREPNDSASFKHLKYGFYLTRNGQLCERKLASAKGKGCNCLFEVYYDSIFKTYTEDTIIEKPLNTIVDINSFVWLDSTEYSKDKSKVFYFNGNSDGGNRVIVDKADPLSFKRLCEYRWGIDKNYVFYKGDVVEGLNLKNLQVLYPPDTSDHFIQYVRDDKNVCYENEILKGGDVKTFRVVSGKKWDAEDKSHKYESGRRLD